MVFVSLNVVYLILAVVLAILIFLIKSTRKPPNFPPGPGWLPILGSLNELTKLTKSLGGQHLALAELCRKYNSNILGLKLGAEKVIVICSYELTKRLSYKYEYNARPRSFFFWLRSMGTMKGISGVDGELWKAQRSFVVTHFRTLGFGGKVMENMVEEETSDILSILNKSEGKEIKIQSVLSVSVLNVLWKLLTGSRLDRYDERLGKLLELLDKRALAFTMLGGALNHFPWIRFLAPEKCGYKLISNLNTELKALLQATINEHYETWTDGNVDDLIYSFITEMKKSNGETTFTEDQLMMVCLDIFIAGSQITSSTLNFALNMMILYPEIQEKVRKSINEAFHQSEEAAFSCRSRVPYVEAVLCEVQRFCHVIPINAPKRASIESQVAGYTIPKDTTLLFSFYAIHHDTAYWKDPEVFRPERFLENGKLVIPERFIPYGYGVRKCLGEILARTCIFTFFVDIIRNFKVELPSEDKDSSKIFHSGITLLPKHRKIRFTRTG